MRSLRWLEFMTPMALAVSAATFTSQAHAEGAPVVPLAEFERDAPEQPLRLAARAATKVAEGQAEQARAPLLPQITTTAQYSRETGNLAPTPAQRSGGGGTSLTSTYDYWQFGVVATQLIYDFGQASSRSEAAERTVSAQRFAERSTTLQVILAVRRAYYGARAAKDLVDVARETLDDQDRHLLQVQGFVGVGTQPPIALAQQAAAVANARVQLTTAQNGYQTAKAQLNQVSGVTRGTDYDVADETPGPIADEDEPLDVLIARATDSRPELATLDEQQRAQEAGVRAAQGAFAPTLSATTGASEVGILLDHLVPNWYASAIVSWPVFEGGFTRGQLHAAEAGLEGVKAQKSLEVLEVRFEVESAQLAVRAAKATVGAAGEAATSAHEQLRLAEQRYATGVGNIIELNDAQVAYTSAAAQVVQARYQLASARAQLLASLGRT
jgi:outer membrane protein